MVAFSFSNNYFWRLNQIVLCIYFLLICITLQCRVNFCRTAQWIGRVRAFVSSLGASFPFRPHWAEPLVLVPYALIIVHAASTVYMRQLYWSTVDLQASAQFFCATKWLRFTYMYIRMLFFTYFPVMVYHKILDIAPCALQEGLVVYYSCILKFSFCEKIDFKK